MTGHDHQIVPGISISDTGKATVDAALADVLFDLAVALEGMTNHPVDVQHVVAAVVLAARRGEIDQKTKLSSGDPSLLSNLLPHVKSVFENFGGVVGSEDD